ncbi:tetratricopeptide repeat protein 27-like isoform X3 [Dioscorea cayenensis subsp. rotundata]|uniref:Tetratricopeptide repeat protein 27-like isoform X3 n=1 Tax=Dioscorea cayennensis subsp. rotundata TaxID=55577 RepID=A0AB40BGB9_DIOCR|nr:tetratricopeptide repeat protein 27-like isoform X3 [Dioscorea cayenensis subsp. rotundata]
MFFNLSNLLLVIQSLICCPNPLPRIEAGDYEKTLDGFIQIVLFDPENGDAWNNIGCLHLKKKKTKKTYVRRNRWELWANYSKVAFDIGNIGHYSRECYHLKKDVRNGEWSCLLAK